nr:hypothetical protein [Oscillospiraceae bacterium]
MLADIIVEIAAEHILTDVPGGYLMFNCLPVNSDCTVHLISCSSASNSGVEKNSPRVMSRPS